MGEGFSGVENLRVGVESPEEALALGSGTLGGAVGVEGDGDGEDDDWLSRFLESALLILEDMVVGYEICKESLESESRKRVYKGVGSASNANVDYPGRSRSIPVCTWVIIERASWWR